MPADVREPDSVRRAFATVERELGGLDVLVNNAAVAWPRTLERASEAELAAMIGTNLMGPLHCMRAAIPLLRARGGGEIVNVSSESVRHPFPLLGIYAASKAALEALSYAVKRELGAEGIRVTVLRSGAAATAGFAENWSAEEQDDAMRLWQEGGLPSVRRHADAARGDRRVDPARADATQGRERRPAGDPLRLMSASPSRARWVLLGCLVCQMGLGFSYVFTTFLKPIVADLGWTRTAFSAAGGPLLLSMALAAPLIGSLTDRFGPRRVLSLSTLLLAAALASFGAMQSLPHFYATSLLFGFALTGLGDIPVGAVAARWFEKSRGLVLGVVYVGSNIGGSLVPIAATAIAARASWRVALVVLGAAAVAADPALRALRGARAAGGRTAGRGGPRARAKHVRVRRCSKRRASTWPPPCERGPSGFSPRRSSSSTSTTSA